MSARRSPSRVSRNQDRNDRSASASPSRFQLNHSNTTPDVLPSVTSNPSLLNPSHYSPSAYSGPALRPRAQTAQGRSPAEMERQYIPAPPPPAQAHAFPPPPPRSAVPPPPPGPPPGPFGWNQWGRGLPPPPPTVNQNQAQNQHLAYSARQPSSLTIPPPPPMNDNPLVSATFIPKHTFGVGVGIPAFEDNPYASHWNAYQYSPPTSASSDTVKPPALSLNVRDPISPGPLTATRVKVDQWPADRVYAWVAGNGFSREWLEAFRARQIANTEFLELGRVNGGAAAMSQKIFPEIEALCIRNKVVYNPAHEWDEGKRMRKLIRRLDSGHRRRGSSQALPSASSDAPEDPGTPDEPPRQARSSTMPIVRGSPTELPVRGSPGPDSQHVKSNSTDSMYKAVGYNRANLHPRYSDRTKSRRKNVAPVGSFLESPTSPRLPASLTIEKPKKKFVFVTPDHWNYRLVDVSNVESAEVLRRVICLELGVQDTDLTQVFLTEAGQIDHEEVLTDTSLWSVCQAHADNLGSLKFFVRCPSSSAFQFPASAGLSFGQRQDARPEVDAEKRAAEIRKAAEDYQQQVRRKQRLIDVDDKKTDLVPLRKPPAAPSESNTLTKVNSLSKKSGERVRPSSQVDLKRVSDPIAEEPKFKSPTYARKGRRSPALSPSPKNRKSYGPFFDFKEEKIAFNKPVQTVEDDEEDEGLFAMPIKEKKPALTVDTESRSKKGRSVAFKSPSTSGPSTRTPDTDRSSRSYSPDRMSRRNSFASEIWASRPPVENVVDHLDEFFPGVDLDEPYLEDGTPSPADITLRSRVLAEKNDSDTLGSDQSTLKAGEKDLIASVAQRAVRSRGLGRMKSIREVAKGRNDLGRRQSVHLEKPVESGILRRKSTKMFGANIVQIRPDRNRLSTLEPIPQEEETPKRQATFKIIRGQLIGKGTYGRVYLGMNATTGDFLAVKQVEVNHKAASHDKERVKEMVSALDQEIDTMQHLEHANIVQYLGCERMEFSISIYLEYIAGGSVGSCLRKHGKFEEAVVRSLTRQTLDGLAYLHGQGILHRDLKADNILLDLDGTCKISDFGISKKSDNIYGNDVTNSMQGSVFWMAPEVVRSQGQGYSAKVDIWSLGCVVLEMFAGRRPWSREEAIGAIFKLGSLNQAPPIPEDVSETASLEGLNFMYNCFEVDPLDRPTAETLLWNSAFCTQPMHYNFYDTELAAKLRLVDAGPANVE